MNPPAFAALVASLLLSACATTGDDSAASAPSRFARFPHDLANTDCFFGRRIDNFEVLNESNLLAMEGRRRVYHVEISPPSMDLRHAYAIEFRSATGRVCGNAGDRMLIANGFVGGFPLSVTGVYRLDETTQAAVRAHFGQPVAAPPVAPEDEDAEALEELVTDLEEEEN